MNTVPWKRSTISGVLLALAGMAIGCGQQTSDNGSKQVAETSHAEGDDHDHSGWWCAEHGVPEEDCSRCSTTAAARFKEKGDWCEEHNRAESQCFACDPSRAEKFAKLYEAKFNEKPPAATE